MTIKEYADILRIAIKTQIGYEKEKLEEKDVNEDFHYGIITGLDIALDKIDASMFLAER